MQKKLKLAVLALCSSSMVVAQNTDTKTNQQAQTANAMDESAFTFTEAQLGENNGSVLKPSCKPILLSA